MARREKKIPYKIFIGGRPMEELTDEEFRAWQDRTVQRMGKAMNDYFNVHPDEYVKVMDELDKRKQEKAQEEGQ